jgi:hypothetical protein
MVRKNKVERLAEKESEIRTLNGTTAKTKIQHSKILGDANYVDICARLKEIDGNETIVNICPGNTFIHLWKNGKPVGMVNITFSCDGTYKVKDIPAKKAAAEAAPSNEVA